MRHKTGLRYGTGMLAVLLLAAGCHKVDSNGVDSSDPASANLAPATGQVNDSLAGAGYAQQGQPAAPGNAAPAVRESTGSSASANSIPPPPPEDTAYQGAENNSTQQQPYADQYAGTQGGDPGYGGVAPGQGSYGEGYDANYEQSAYGEQYAEQPPPPLPEYQQPPCPGDNYLWTPGYWGYATTGYAWVPGVWVVAPFVGALWTPGFWGFDSGRYAFHHGFWGPHIGFYGGINYGYGYFGHGYEGGYWNRNNFYYNRSVTVINNTNIRNVYVHNVSYQNFGNRVAYNGGRGGLEARPAVYEQAAAREQHYGALPVQQQHVQQALANRGQFAGFSGGRPQTLAAARPLAGRTVETAQAARLRPVANQGGFERPGFVGNNAVRAQTEQQRAQDAQGHAQFNQQQATAEQTRAQQSQQRAIENPRNGAADQARAQEQQQRAVESQQRAVDNQNRAQNFAQQSGNRQAEANQNQALQQQQRAQVQQRQAQEQQQRVAQQNQQQTQEQAREQQQHAQGEQQRALEQQQRVQQPQQEQRAQPQFRPEQQPQQHSEPAPHEEAPHAEGGGHGPH